jgi:predicted Rossmann fold flavoprotein
MNELTTRLSGASLVAGASTAGVSFTDDVLFTHRGLSGPAALQLSSYWAPGSAIELDLLPGRDATALLLDARDRQPRTLVRTVLAEALPTALVRELQQIMWPDVRERPLAELSGNTIRSIGKQLHCWKLKPSGTEGYRTAEVTLGGIDTNELSSKTMECKRQPGLFCIGEVVDVTGHLGGFNFQWAWASGWAAGQSV